MTVRTRFAPSPTGYLHVGGARTALFSWLYARHHGGRFVLRIEDTDVERSTPESVQAILDGMAWLDLDYDEGPYFQTQRFDRYRQALQQLLATDRAYPCYCSKERLETLRETQMRNKEKPRYDGHCRHLPLAPEGADAVVRFKNPEHGAVVVDDLIRGRVVFQNQELDDLIIARTDGTPTYNFCVVVDDLDMRITHVIRGDDHLNNTPRQMNILQALGAEPPHYAHVSMILGDDGKRLSKRHGAVSVLQFQQDGVLPEALCNHLIRLGWAHGDQELFTRTEMIRLFDIGAVNHAAASFNADKLLWLNQHYMKQAEPARLAVLLETHLMGLGVQLDAGPALPALVLALRERVKTLAELAEQSRHFFVDYPAYETTLLDKHLTPEASAALHDLRARFETLTAWTAPAIHEALQHIAEQRGLKLGKLAQPLRVMLTGGTVSPPIDITAALTGRARCLARMDHVLARVSDPSVAC